MTFLFSLSPLPINIEPNPERDQIRDTVFCDTLPAKLDFASRVYEVRRWETMSLVQEGSANDKLLPCRSERPGCGALPSLFPFQAPSMSVSVTLPLPNTFYFVLQNPFRVLINLSSSFFSFNEFYVSLVASVAVKMCIVKKNWSWIKVACLNIFIGG